MTVPASTKLGKPLTLMQRKWAHQWLETGNATEAAARAGYSGDRAAHARIGFDNRRNTKIADYIEALIAESPLFASAGEQARILTEIARGEGTMTRETPKGTLASGPTFADRLRAVELLGKMVRPEGVSVHVTTPDEDDDEGDGDVRISVEFKRGVSREG